MDCIEMLLDSWDRQCQMVNAVAGLVDEDNRHAKPSVDGWGLDAQLAHIHGVRRFFLKQVASEQSAQLKSAYADSEGTPIQDLEAIKSHLHASHLAVREAVSQAMAGGGGAMKSENVTYDNPVLLLQHMVWHEGWHVGLMILALRLNGQEPPEEWEEPNIWGRWRTETW